MKCINQYIFISYDPKERFKIKTETGFELVIPEWWAHVDGWGAKTGKMVENINGLEVNPQVGYVLVDNDDFNLKCGDKIFFHYLAIDYPCEIDDQIGAFIDANDVFFVDNGSIEMIDDFYLGDQVFDEIPKTESGIWLDFLERKKECYIKLTYVPKNSKFHVGDCVFSIDGAQYQLTYNNKKHIKLESDEIIGKLSNG